MENVKCNLCGKDNTELVFEVEEQITGEHKRFRIVKCNNDGLVYVNPRPSKDEIISYYPPTYYEHRPPGKGKKLRRGLKKLIRERLPGYSMQTGTFGQIWGKCIGKMLLSQIDIVVPFKENGRILDVGCGNGEVIGWMKEYGWDIHGVDTAKKACEVAEKQGLKTFCGQLLDAGYPEGYFDTIIINHVLEHVHDPLSLLRECNRIMKQDGLLIVDVPNFGSFHSKLFGKTWHSIMCPVHLYHFTYDSLNRIIAAAGFQVKKWKHKLALPFYYKPSIKRYICDNPGLLSLLNILFKASAGMFIKFIFSKNKVAEFSINLIAYASKCEQGGEIVG